MGAAAKGEKKQLIYTKIAACAVKKGMFVVNFGIIVEIESYPTADTLRITFDRNPCLSCAFYWFRPEHFFIISHESLL